METIYPKIFLYVIIVLSSVFHEFAHSFIAYRLGDNTAKDAGRLTLNPFKHLDPVGTVAVPLFLLFTSGIFIGWAKPVPYNPYNLRDPKYGSLKVGAAGPGANLLIAAILGLFLRFSPKYLFMAGFANPLFFEFIGLIVYINIFLALFNLIPLPPLDGSKILMDLLPRQRVFIEQLGFIGIFLALFVAFFLLSPLARIVFWIITGQSF